MRPSHFPLYLSFYHWIDYFLKFVDGLENAYYIFHFLFFTANSIPSFQGVGGSEWALEKSDSAIQKKYECINPAVSSLDFSHVTHLQKKKYRYLPVKLDKTKVNKIILKNKPQTMFCPVNVMWRTLMLELGRGIVFETAIKIV